MHRYQERYKNQPAHFTDMNEARSARVAERACSSRLRRAEVVAQHREVTQSVRHKRETELQRWRRERAIQREKETGRKKPAFKVGLVHHRYYSPPVTAKSIAEAQQPCCCRQRSHRTETSAQCPSATRTIATATQKKLERRNRRATSIAASTSMPAAREASEPARRELPTKTTDSPRTRLSFAPENHQFKPPVGLDPIPMFGRYVVPRAAEVDGPSSRSENAAVPSEVEANWPSEPPENRGSPGEMGRKLHRRRETDLNMLEAGNQENRGNRRSLEIDVLMLSAMEENREGSMIDESLISADVVRMLTFTEEISEDAVESSNAARIIEEREKSAENDISRESSRNLWVEERREKLFGLSPSIAEVKTPNCYDDVYLGSEVPAKSEVNADMPEINFYEHESSEQSSDFLDPDFTNNVTLRGRGKNKRKKAEKSHDEFTVTAASPTVSIAVEYSREATGCSTRSSRKSRANRGAVAETPTTAFVDLQSRTPTIPLANFQSRTPTIPLANFQWRTPSMSSPRGGRRSSYRESIGDDEEQEIFIRVLRNRTIVITPGRTPRRSVASPRLDRYSNLLNVSTSDVVDSTRGHGQRSKSEGRGWEADEPTSGRKQRRRGSARETVRSEADDCAASQLKCEPATTPRLRRSEKRISLLGDVKPDAIGAPKNGDLMWFDSP